MSSRKDFLKVLGLSAFSPLFTESLTGFSQLQDVVKPKRLSKGDTVGIVSPAAPVYGEEKIEIMKESMEALGFKVVISDHVTDQWGYFAGQDKLRAEEVNKMFANPEIDGIVCARGGWGCSRILPYLNYEMIAENPKVIIGYSDVTSLLLALHAKTGLVTFHGPVGTSEWKDFSVKYFRSVLMDAKTVTMSNPKEKEDTLTQIKDRVNTIRKGTARGRLMGGNLTVLTTIIGSDYLPDWDNAILFLEDVNEDLTKEQFFKLNSKSFRETMLEESNDENLVSFSNTLKNMFDSNIDIRNINYEQYFKFEDQLYKIVEYTYLEESDKLHLLIYDMNQDYKNLYDENKEWVSLDKYIDFLNVNTQ